VNSADITEEVNTWMTTHKVTYPFDEDTMVLFCLTWG